MTEITHHVTEAAPHGDGEDLEPRDHATHRAAIPVLEDPARHVSYFIVTIPASSAGAPSVRLLLPQDYDRSVAYVMPIDEPIVIAPTLEQAQDVNNLSGSFSGSYQGGGWSPPIRHTERVYGCNTSTSAACRVSVMVETRGPA